MGRAVADLRRSWAESSRDVERAKLEKAIFRILRNHLPTASLPQNIGPDLKFVKDFDPLTLISSESGKAIYRENQNELLRTVQNAVRTLADTESIESLPDEMT